MNDVLYKGTIKGFPLIKFQNEEIINKTIGGSFYMNSLKHYRELELVNIEKIWYNKSYEIHK